MPASPPHRPRCRTALPRRADPRGSPRAARLHPEPWGWGGLLPGAESRERDGAVLPAVGPEQRTAHGLRVALPHTRTNVQPRDSLDIKKALITII